MSDAANVVMNFPRRDASDKLRGRTRYAVDRPAPACSTARWPAPKFRRGGSCASTPAAVAMPGVHAVVTEADAPPPRRRHRRPPALCLTTCASTASRSPRSRRRRSARPRGGGRDRRRDRAAARRHIDGRGARAVGARAASRLGGLRGSVRRRGPRRQRRMGGDGRARRHRCRVRARRREVVESEFASGARTMCRSSRAPPSRATRTAASISRPPRRCPGRCAARPRACWVCRRPRPRHRAAGRRRLRAEVRFGDRALRRPARAADRSLSGWSFRARRRC